MEESLGTFALAFGWVFSYTQQSFKMEKLHFKVLVTNCFPSPPKVLMHLLIKIIDTQLVPADYGLAYFLLYLISL